MGAALEKHWPEYCIEAACLGIFMLSACLFGVLLEHPASVLHRVLPNPFARRALMGVAMGLTAIAIVYSPWGRRSGAHINPGVTVSFLRLKKVTPIDSMFYIVAQCAGAVAGVLVARFIFALPIEDPAVNWVATIPGQHGALVAFAAELAISFFLMTVVLVMTRHPRSEPWTGWAAGACVCLFITFEAPLSGMSMNPARTLGSALPAGEWGGFWIYASAPLIGMLAAAESSRFWPRLREAGCAKLRHCERVPCIFCGTTGRTPSRALIEGCKET